MAREPEPPAAADGAGRERRQRQGLLEVRHHRAPRLGMASGLLLGMGQDGRRERGSPIAHRKMPYHARAPCRPNPQSCSRLG
jgi:hypothetical protein